MSRSFVHKSKNPRYDYESTQYTNNQSRNFRSYLLLRMYNVYYFLRCKMSDRSNESILNFSKVYIEINIQITSELILFYSDKLLSSAIFFYFKASYFFFFWTYIHIVVAQHAAAMVTSTAFITVQNWSKTARHMNVYPSPDKLRVYCIHSRFIKTSRQMCTAEIRVWKLEFLPFSCFLLIAIFCYHNLEF